MPVTNNGILNSGREKPARTDLSESRLTELHRPPRSTLLAILTC